MRSLPVLSLLVLASLAGCSLAAIRPAIGLNDLHPVDACLFGCHMCFEKVRVSCLILFTKESQERHPVSKYSAGSNGELVAGFVCLS